VISFQSVFPTFRGGISKFSDHLYSHLVSRVDVRASNYSSLYPSILFPGKTQYLTDSDDKYAKSVVHAYNPLSWKSSVDLMITRDTRYYIYSHWHPFFAVSQTSIIKEIKFRYPNVEIAGIIHNVLPHEKFPFQKSLSRKLFNLTDYPIVLSTQSDNEYRELMHGKRPEKLFHPVYDEEWPDEDRNSIRKRLGYDEKDILVLFFGLVRPYKGLDVLIDALNLINLENTRIKPIIVGEFYIDPQTILNKIKPSHLPLYEIINRYVPDDEAASFMLAADLMVLPYRSASQSGVLSNALNYSLPVVVSDLAGLTEQVEYGKTGFIVPPGDSVSLAKELYHIATNVDLPQIRENVSHKKQSLSWERFTDELMAKLKIYE
jgi:glycosyltransferase involved in cell wall biosynthesis